MVAWAGWADLRLWDRFRIIINSFEESSGKRPETLKTSMARSSDQMSARSVGRWSFFFSSTHFLPFFPHFLLCKCIYFSFGSFIFESTCDLHIFVTVQNK